MLPRVGPRKNKRTVRARRKQRVLNEQLLKAVMHGGRKYILATLRMGAKVNARFGSEKETVLHWAAKKDRDTVCRNLIENGANVNARNAHGDTPLHEAISCFGTKTARILLSNGAKVNAKGDHLLTPLHHAVMARNCAMIKLLITKKANVNARDADGLTPLHYAKNSAIVKILVDNGADINARGFGITPLVSAVKEGKTDVVKALVRMGADTTLDDHEGHTPRDHAFTRRNCEMLRALQPQSPPSSKLQR